MSGQTDLGPFSIVPRWVAQGCSGQPWALALYVCLADHADRTTDNGWTIGREGLASELSTSAATVDRAVKVLVDLGALVVERNRKGKEWTWSRYLVRAVKSSQVGQGGVLTSGTGVITGDDIPNNPPSVTPPGRPKKPLPAERIKAEEIVRAWWDEREVKPAVDFMGTVKLIQSLHGKGWTVPMIERAIREVPVVTKAALDFWLSKQSQGQDKPKPRFRRFERDDGTPYWYGDDGIEYDEDPT